MPKIKRYNIEDLEKVPVRKENIWSKSPQTGKDMVLKEFDDKHGVSQVDLSVGYYTNEFPLNYKKHPDFDIKKYEENMPNIIKDYRFDDGESYWYPSTIQTQDEMLFPVGKVQLMAGDEAQGDEIIKWCYAKIKKLTKEELDKVEVGDFESKLDMEKEEYFVNYLDAAKKVSGYSLGDL